MCRNIKKYKVYIKFRFYQDNSKILGVDWNENFIEVALRKPVHSNIDVQYKTEDIENMTLKSDIFDSVVDTFGLIYTLNPKKCLKEMSRVCKPDGKIILIENGLSHYEY